METSTCRERSDWSSCNGGCSIYKPINYKESIEYPWIQVLYILYTLPGWKCGQKQGHTLLYFTGLPLALIAPCICCGIVLLSLCNVARFISIHCCIKCSPRSCMNEDPKILSWFKVWTLWWPIHVWKWCLMLPEPLFCNLSPMNPGVVILEYPQAVTAQKEALSLLSSCHTRLRNIVSCLIMDLLLLLIDYYQLIIDWYHRNVVRCS